MGNIDRLKSIYQTAETSEGSAQRAEEVFETSIQYSINKAKASLQELSYDFLDSGLFKGLVEGANVFLQVLDQIIETLGTIPPLLATIGGARALKQTLGGNTNWIQSTIAKATAMKTGGASSSIVKNLKDLFTSSAQKANLGGEVAKITAEQLASKGQGLTGFLSAYRGKSVNLSKNIAESFGMKGGIYDIGVSNEGFTTITKHVQEAGSDAAEAMNEAFASDLNLDMADDGVITLTQNVQNLGAEATGAGNALRNAFSGIGSILAANPLFTGMLVAGAVAGIVKLVDYINKAGERAKSKMDDSVKDYTESNQEIKDLNTQLKETKDRMRELNSQKALTLVERNELNNLDQVNKKLEAQISAQKSLNKLKADQMLADAGTSFDMNFGESLPSYEDVKKTVEYWSEKYKDAEGLLVGQNIDTTDIREQLAFYSTMSQKIDEAEKSGEKLSDAFYSSRNQMGQTLSAQLESAQAHIDAFELIGVKGLNKTQKRMYDEAVELRDTIIHVINPEQWEMNKVDEILSSSEFSNVRKTLSSDIKKIISSAGEGASLDSILETAEQSLASSVPQSLIDSLTEVGMNANDVIDALVREAIDGSGTVAEVITQDIEQAAERATSLMTNVNKLRDDSLNRSPAESVSYEDYQLVMDTPALYDYAEAFEVVNGVMTVNRDKWKEITEAKLESERVNLDTEREAAKTDLTAQQAETERLKNAREQLVAAQLASTGQAYYLFGEQISSVEQQLADSEAEEASILRRIKGYDLLMQTLGEGTDAYHTFVAAQSAATSGEMFTKASEAYQALYDIFDPNSDTFGMSGAGNPVYEAAIEFVIPEEVREKGKEEIQNYLRSMWDYLETDADGKFTGELKLKDFATNLEHAMNLDEGMQVFPDFKSKLEYLISDAGAGMMKAIASEMNLTEDALRAMIGEIMMYGDDLKEISINLDFKDAIEDSNTLISNLSTIDGMLGKALGASDLQSIFGSEQLKKYSSALEVVNGQLQLNAEKVKQIHDEEVQAQKDENLAVIQGYKDELGGIVTPERAEWLRNRITELEAYNAALDATSTKFSEFRQAQEMEGQQGQLFKDTTEAFQAIRDAFDETSESFGKKGLVYEAAIKLVIPESVRDQGEQAIENYVDDMAKFWREDVDGKFTGELDFGKISDYLKVAQDKMARGGRQIDIAKLFNLGETDKIDLANYIGISTEGLESIIGVFQEYGITTFEELDAMAEQMNFKQAVDDTTKLTSNLQTIGSIISNISSGKALSFDEITSLFESDQLKEYLAALEVVNGQMVLNPQTVRDIRANQIGKQVNVNEALIQSYQKQPASDINTERITRLRLYNQALKESTSAYNAWVEGQSQEASTTFMDNSLAAIQKINEVFTRTSETFGMVGQGNQAYQLAVDVILPEELDRTDTRTVKNYIDSLGDMIDKDLNGEIKGIKISAAIKKALDKGLLQQRNGLYDFGRNTIEDIAKGMNVSNDIAKALVEYMNAFGNKAAEINMSNLVSDFESATSDASQLLDQMGSLETILSGQTVGKSLSFEDFKTLYDTPSLQKYIGALEAYNGELRLNADMVREIAKAEGERQIGEITDEKNKKMREYSENLKRINELQAKGSDISAKELNELSGLQSQNDLIVAQCRGYDLLAENIRNATGAYQNWLNMKGADNSDKMFDEATEAANALKEGLKTGETGKGNMAYQGALDFIIPDTIDKEDDAAVKKYLDSIDYVFKKDSEGKFDGFNLDKFLDKAVDKGMMQQVGDEYRLAGAMSMQEFADGMGMSLELVQAIFGAMDMYKNTFAWTDPDQFNGLVDKAEYAANAINSLNPEMDLKVDFSEIEDGQEKISAIDDEIKKVSDYQATLEVDSKEWRQAQTLLNYYEVLKKQAELPAVLTVDVSNASQEVQYGVDLLSRLYTAVNEVDAAEAEFGVDSSEAQEAKEKVEELEKELNTTDGQNAMVSIGIEGATTAQSAIEQAYNQSGTATVNIGLGTNTAQSEIDKMGQEKVDIEVNINDEETQGKIDTLENRLNTLSETEHHIEVIVDTEGAMETFKEVDDAELEEKELVISGDGSRATQAINFINRSKVNDKQIKITAQNLAIESINRLKNELNRLQGKTIEIKTVYTTVHQSTGGGSSPGGTHGLSGTAHASGTARPRPYTVKDLTGEAKLHGDWGMSEGKRVLIGELGPEIVVDPKSGRWRTYGDMGAEFAYIPKNAIIFNHLQTRDLLEKGYVNGRGGALASGTAFANGNQNVSGGIKKTTTTSSGTTKSSSGSGNSGNNKSSSNNSSDKEPTKIDWIETLLSRIQRLFDNFKNLAEYYTTYTYQNKELQRAVVQAQQNVNKQQQAAKVYYDLAKSKAGSYWDKIINGALKIEDISNENTAKAVQEAKDLYEKYLQCTDQVVELRKELLELARTKLDNIVDDYDSLNGYAEQYISLLDAQIERRDTMGGQTDILKRNQQDIDQLKQMADYYNDIKTAASDYAATYQGQITDNLAKGFYKIGSQEWIDAKTQLYDLQTQAYEAATSVEELNERIRELNWYSFKEGLAVIEHVDKQLGSTIDLIKDLEVYSDKTAAVNENGISQFNLYASALANARQQVADYSVAIKALDGELASGMITQDKYNEELRDYREKQMDAVKQVKSYRDAIIDLVKKGIQAETKAMSDLISKRKEDLKKQKEANDYAKKISDKTKEINKIKAQITALSGDTTAATQAKIRQLQADLAKQEEELAETRMDHEYDMRTQAMDDELDRFKEIQDAKTLELETSLDAQEKAIAETLAFTSSQYEQITDELTKLAEMYGVQLEDFVVNPWKDATAALEEYKRAIETTPSTTVSIETDNAVHKNNHSGTAGQSTLVESGTNGQSDTPFGQGGPNFTTADATNSEKMRDEIASAKIGKEDPNLKFSINKSTQVMKDPSTYSTAVKTLNSGSTVTGTGNNKQVSGTWWREVTIDGQKYWINANDMTKIEPTTTTTQTKTTTPTTQTQQKTTTTTPATEKYTVKTDKGLYLRKDAGKSNDSIDKIPNGTVVEATGKTKTVDGKVWREIKYNGKTGWSMGDYLIKKAARGARVASGLYLTDEEGIGSEAIITKKGVLRQLDSATVFSKEQTDRLWKLSKSDLLENIKPSAFAGGISLSYGSLLTVNGNVDRDALPGLQDLLKQACEYTKRDLKQNLMKMGMR